MGSESRTHRLFFALWPNDELREQLARAVKSVLEGRRGRPVRAANLHMTLAFLGSVAEDRVRDVIDAADEVSGEPFDLVIDRVESVRTAHVAWLAVARIPPALADLVERLRFSLSARKVAVDQKDFRAHVTIARDWRDKRLDERIGPFAWSASEFVLVGSTPGPQGSEYRILGHWPLRPKDRE